MQPCAETGSSSTTSATADPVHPGDDAMIAMGENLVAELEALLEN